MDNALVTLLGNKSPLHRTLCLKNTILDNYKAQQNSNKAQQNYRTIIHYYQIR